ncbi:MAG TPA: GAF domain-containing protein, partial [Candidatus Binatia bacterium]|nr:GAF domain-containing protein [Candidatus Binatia bacterium]
MDGDSSSLEILDARQSSLQDLDEIIARFEATFPKTELHVFLLDDSDHELRQVAGVSHNLQSDLPDKAMERVLHNGTVLLLDESGQRLEPAAPDVSKVSDAFVPVKARGGTAGVLLARCAGATFSTHCLTYLQTVASYVGIALHARQLVDHAWQRTAEIETVYGVTETARSLKPLYPTLVEIHAHVTRAFDVPSFYVALYDTDAGTITFPYAVDNGEEVRLEPIPVEQQDSLVAWVIRHRRPYATGNWPEERPVPGLLVSGSTPRSILCYPLQVDGDLVGALSLQSDEAQAFDEHEANILASIADQVAVVVHNSRVYSKSQKLVDNMAQEYLAAAAMRQAVSAMGTSLDADEVLDRLLAAVGDMVEIDSASVVLVHGETLEFHKHLAYDGTGEEELLQSANRQLQQAPLLKRVALQREPLVIDDVRDEESWIPVEGLDYVRSFAAVPMIAANEVIGILTLDAARPGVYGQREIWLITTLTSHASLAFQNARLHAELQSRVRELTTLYEASAAISADLDRDSVLRTVVGEMVRALDVDACLILVPQGLSGLRVAIDHNAPDSDVTASAAPDAGREQLVGTVEAHPTVRGTFEDGELVSLNAHEALSEQEQSLLQQLRLSSVLLVPLVQADRMGVLLLGRQELARPFLERDVRLSRNLAAQAAAAIEHAHLYTQAQRRIDELSTFHQIVLQLNTPLEIEVVLQNITEAALRLIEANNLHIYLWDAESDEFTFCSALWRDGSREPAVAAPRKDGLTASVVHGGEAIIIDNANDHPLYRDPEASKWGVQ